MIEIVSSQVAKYLEAVIITVKRLQQAAKDYRDGATGIAAWIRVVKQPRWRNSAELRASFPDADDVDGIVIFNLRPISPLISAAKASYPKSFPVAANSMPTISSA